MSGYLSFKSHDVLKEIELVYIVVSAILRGEQKRTKKSKQIHKALVGISVYSVVSVISNNKQIHKVPVNKNGKEIQMSREWTRTFVFVFVGGGGGGVVSSYKQFRLHYFVFFLCDDALNVSVNDERLSFSELEGALLSYVTVILL